ncbi:hypothetical protein DPEC_G00214160 [Dallia pectoralis]|uniref:Uncharacterized protein n=1 Tax=Dallia pectoralis TaxID=75939 RepID=A0ACC2G209_DALPE|nr:hypothetical protein DPEC_G00214160 [Dallia pectoralis]
MDSHGNSEFFSLAEEKFDFDVSLSPVSSKEDDDDDEVFVGPVCHKERCISVGLETVVKEDVSSGPPDVEEQPWSPMQGVTFEEICKEAHLLASQLEVSKQPTCKEAHLLASQLEVSKQPTCKEAHLLASQLKVSKQPTSKEAHLLASQLEVSKQPTCKEVNGPETVVKEDFLQDNGAKLSVLNKPATGVISPIKRETFCVQDSPLKQLPPAIQQRLIRSGAVSTSTKGRVSTSSPLRAGTTSQPKMVLRGRAGLACNPAVLPSKQRPAARGATVTTAMHTAKTRAATAERTVMLPPPNKGNSGLSRSPASRYSSRTASTSRNSSRAASTEELFSDTASVTSDISDSSLDSSLQGKRTFLPVGKSGIRAPSTAKAPEPQTRRVMERKRNTSSSSSSVSSFNSSMSLSPTGKGKVNTSLNSSTIGPNGRISRLPNPSVSTSKTSKPALTARGAETLSTAGARRSISVHGRKPSEPDHSKPVRPTHVRKAELVSTATPSQQTPAKRNMERTSSVPNVPTLSLAKVEQLRGNPKVKGLIAPTPTSQVKRRLDVFSTSDAPRIMNPKRLMSVCSVESPHKPVLPIPELLRTPSAGGNKAVQARLRSSSALPTPVNRRITGIPMLTPKGSSHTDRTSLSTANLPASIRRASYRSPAPVIGNLQVEVVAVPEEGTIQPFCLEDEPEVRPTTKDPPEDPDVSLIVSAPNTEDQESLTTNTENLQPEPKEDSMELPSVEPPQDNGMKSHDFNEIMLVDAPVPVLRPKEKLLIDLTNTPDLIRTASVKPSGGQLIDLSSPLIKWSPENNNEPSNDAPLINLSF